MSRHLLTFQEIDLPAIRGLVTYQRSSAAANAKLGNNLARLRNSIGLSQAKMAERLGISLRHFQRVESGESAPSIPLLIDLHKIFKTTWDELFSGL
jgi:DNA-binding XRE family transcriptional regulator